MNTMETILKRSSKRDFKNEKIDEKSMEQILKAAWAAPVGMRDYDSVHLTVVTNEDLLGLLKKHVCELFRQPDVDFYYGAPVVILLSSKENKKMPNLEYANAGCIIENMMLAATDLEIGSVYIFGAMTQLENNKEVMEKLNLPEGFRPISAVALGYSNSPIEARDLVETIKVDYI